MLSLWLVRQKETLFLSVALDPNSQPSSHNYYHHQDLTLSTFVLLTSRVHTVYSAQIVLGNVLKGYKLRKQMSKANSKEEVGTKFSGKPD